MKHHNIDTKILLYNSLQFRYHKAIRVKYNLTNPQFQVLCSLYYITTTPNPPRERVKAQLLRHSPHINWGYVRRSLVILDNRGLIAYDVGDGRYNYSIELTPLGIEVIESLFTVGNVECFLNSRVKGLNL